MINCYQCSKATKNPRFCSSSCSAIYNNPRHLKRKWKCKKCLKEKQKPSEFAKVCLDCRHKPMSSNCTVGQIRERYKNRKWGALNLHTLIRDRARYYMTKQGHTSCQKCGYSKHIQISHTKPIVSFPNSAKVSEINDPSNLQALCPNCHWEFDHPDK